MTSRAMTRYVVYFPPPIRTTPFVSTVTRCSRDALTVDPPDGAISGRRPAYVPTTSSRRRSTSIVVLTVSRSRSDLPAIGRRVGRGAFVRRIGRADQPVVGPRHQEHDLARAPGSSARAGSGSARAAPPGARRGSAGSAASRCRTAWSGSAAQTPVASTTARVLISNSEPVIRSCARTASSVAVRASTCGARSRGRG